MRDIYKLFTCFVSIALFTLVDYSFAASTGIRLGATTVQEGMQWEVFARPSKEYVMGEFSFGVGKFDYVINGIPATDVKQYPFSAVLGVQIPSESIKPYAAVGVSLLFNELKKTYGSPVIQTGLEIPITKKASITFDYRHQFNQPTNYWLGGVGIKF